MMTRKQFINLLLEAIEEGYFVENNMEDFYINYVLPITKDSIEEILAQWF